jgi:hypothetical protein
MINFVQLHILCNHDERSEEDLALEQQFASMGIEIKPREGEEQTSNNKVFQEWRPGLIQVAHISTVYPHSNPQHSLIHLHAGSIVTVQESYEVIIRCLNQALQPAVPSPGYSYSLIEAKPPVIKPVISPTG